MITGKRLVEPSFFYKGKGMKEGWPFYVAYSIWLVVALLNTTPLVEYLGHRNMFYAVVPILLFIGELKEIRSYSKLEWISLFALIALNIQTYVFGGNNLAILSMLLFCSRKMKFSDIALISVLVDTVILVVIPSMTAFGLIEDVINIRPNGTVRSSLGFSYVTYASYVLKNIVMLAVLFVPFERVLGKTIYLLLFIANTVILMETDARNGCGLIYIALLISPVLQKYEKTRNRPLNENSLLGRMIVNDYLILFALFLVAVVSFTLFPKSKLLQWMDSLCSLRLTYTSYAFGQFGIPLFGGTGVDLIAEGLTIDSSYFRIVYEHGLIVLLLVVVGLQKIQVRLCEDGNITLLFVLFLVAVHSVFDAQLISVQHNTLILLLASLFPGGQLFGKAATKKGGAPGDGREDVCIVDDD